MGRGAAEVEEVVEQDGETERDEADDVARRMNSSFICFDDRSCVLEAEREEAVDCDATDDSSDNRVLEGKGRALVGVGYG